ncbi:MAG: response regulator transcription factor [Chitinophagaceae bacterium]|nr:response regulator transcription factor [Chitinophagaceae bacterium]
MNTKKKLLAIVDDHQIVIDGLKSLLDGHDGFSVAIECTSPVQMLEELKKTPVDILLTDVMMPVMNGAELASAVRKQFPQIKILALSMSGQGDVVNRMIEEADISGYVVKNIGKKDLVYALEKIASGGLYFTDEILAEMSRASEMQKVNEEVNLSAREIEVVKLIEKEYSNKLIADTLFLSERTVETHRKNIFRKTKTNSVIGLIKYAYEHKLIEQQRL